MLLVALEQHDQQQPDAARGDLRPVTGGRQEDHGAEQEAENGADDPVRHATPSAHRGDEGAQDSEIARFECEGVLLHLAIRSGSPCLRDALDRGEREPGEQGRLISRAGHEGHDDGAREEPAEGDEPREQTAQSVEWVDAHPAQQRPRDRDVDGPRP